MKILGARRIGDRVGDAPIHGRKAGCRGVAEPACRHWRRLCREGGQPIEREMAGEVDQNIDAILADLVTQGLVIDSDGREPMMRQTFEARGDRILVIRLDAGIAKRFDRDRIMRRQQGLEEISN
jgi:hypothetical protein